MLEEWEPKLREVIPDMGYVDETPGIADGFDAALKRFVDTANAMLTRPKRTARTA